MVTKTYDGRSTQQLIFDASSSTENILQVSNITGWSEYRDGDDLVLFSSNATDYLRVLGAYSDATRLEYIQYLFDAGSSPKYLVSEIDDVPSSGAHFFAGTSANDVITTSPADPSSATGYLGDDQITGSSGTDYLGGNDGDDTITGGAGDDVLIGGSGNDTLDGGAGNDALDGGTGNDILQGGAGDDTLDGGDGEDVLLPGANAQTGVVIDTKIGLASDGLGGVDAISNFEAFGGTPYADQFFGRDTDASVAIELNAVSGNVQNYEVFRANAGDDTIDGRGGYDEVNFNSATVGLTIDLATTQQPDGMGGTDNISNIEGVEATNYDDTIYGTDGANSLDGRLGNNTIDGRDGYDFVEYNGDDRHHLNADLSNGIASFTKGLDGTSYTDTLINIEGVVGSSNNDTIKGDAKDNRLYGGDGDDTLDGGAGDDTIEGGDGNDTLAGGLGNDTVRGGAGDDTIFAVGGSDTFDGGEGSDTLVEDNTGLEEFSVDLYFDLSTGKHGVFGKETGIDEVISIENYTIEEAFNVTLKGDENANMFTANAGDDVLYGFEGDDMLSGGTGADVIDGGAGKDKLTGGSGSDTFQFYGVFEHDVITDYNSDEDTLEFYAGDGSTLNISDLVETVNSDGDRVLSTTDGLSSVTLEGTAGITPVSGGLDISIVSMDGDVVTFGVFASPSADPDEDGIGSFDFVLSHDPSDMLIDGNSIVSGTGYTALPNYNATTGVLITGGFALPSVTDFLVPLATFSATILDNTNPIDLTISEISIDGDPYDGVMEAFNFSSVDVESNVIGRGSKALFDVSVSYDFVTPSEESQSIELALQETGKVTYAIDRGSDLTVIADKAIDSASDKAIGAFDALQALRLAVGLDKSDGTSVWHDYIAADINKDGRVGADDALNILKFAVGLTDGPSADWVFVDGDADHSGIDRSNTDYNEGIRISDVMTDMSINMTGILVGDVDGSYIA